MSLYTKNGRRLRVSGDMVYSCSGMVVGRIKGKKVFGTDGRYVGTIASGRLVRRSIDSTTGSSRFSAANRSGPGAPNTAGSPTSGYEPDIPD